MTSLEDQLAKSAERFTSETSDHKMTVLRNDGVYRHLRFMNPRNSAYWFEIHTGPSFLLFRGDGDSYVFSNGDLDMFRSFRHSIFRDGSLHPDPGYWTQKLSSGEQAEKWSPEVFEEDLEAQIVSLVEEEVLPPEHEERFRHELGEHLLYEDLSSADLAVKAVDEFDFYFEEPDRYKSGHRPDVEFDDPWEWITHCTEYQWWYLWALHGILHGIRQYDRQFGRPGVALDTATAGVPIG